MMIRICLAMLSATALATAARADDWQTRLKKELPALGHRNWIVVADSAYPAQIAPGIETIYVGGDQLQAVAEVLSLVATQKHVRPKVFCDAELFAVGEEDAPGITAYRDHLASLLKEKPVQYVPHEEVINKLDEAAKTFRVIIIKTDLALPYTSVFLELDCGYWSAEAEQRLRDRLRDKEEPTAP
jgi:D-ribose pyranose/furanose isomerase RbsD